MLTRRVNRAEVVVAVDGYGYEAARAVRQEVHLAFTRRRSATELAVLVRPQHQATPASVSPQVKPSPALMDEKRRPCADAHGREPSVDAARSAVALCSRQPTAIRASAQAAPHANALIRFIQASVDFSDVVDIFACTSSAPGAMATTPTPTAALRAATLPPRPSGIS